MFIRCFAGKLKGILLESGSPKVITILLPQHWQCRKNNSMLLFTWFLNAMMILMKIKYAVIVNLALSSLNSTETIFIVEFYIK